MGVIALLSVAMAAATHFQVVLSLLSQSLISEFAISRSQLGAAFTVFALTGGAVAPIMGALSDRGSRRSLMALFALGTAGTLVAAGSPGYRGLLLAAFLSGLALGTGNPVTNRIVYERIAPERRGWVIGLKQAGSPLGLLINGMLLPVMAVTWGWRPALAATALVPMVGLMAVRHLIPREIDEPAIVRSTISTCETRATLTTARLTVSAFTVGMANSIVIVFLPLYAYEAVGLSVTAAGWLAASLGLAAVLGRIGWGGLGARLIEPAKALPIVSLMAMLGVAGVGGAARVGPLILWFATLGVGASALAWYTAAWLVIVKTSGVDGVGRRTGVMQVLGEVGFAIGPPLAGTIVDLSGSYSPVWGFVGLLFLVSALITLRSS